jgi:hypothetical protein
MGDTVMTLWILFCRMSEKWDTLFAFYAKDREDLALGQGTPSPDTCPPDRVPLI